MKKKKRIAALTNGWLTRENFLCLVLILRLRQECFGFRRVPRRGRWDCETPRPGDGLHPRQPPLGSTPPVFNPPRICYSSRVSLTRSIRITFGFGGASQSAVWASRCRSGTQTHNVIDLMSINGLYIRVSVCVLERIIHSVSAKWLGRAGCVGTSARWKEVAEVL